MKSIIRYFALFSLTLGALSSCTKDMSKEGGYQTPAVKSFAPMTSLSKATNPGTEVTLDGINLHNVAKVLVGGIEAQVTSSSRMQLKFVIPFSDSYTQGEVFTAPIEVLSTIDKAGSFSWKKEYFLFVDPYEAIVTKCTPLTAAIGDQVVFEGYNMQYVSAIKFGEVTILAALFDEQTTTKIKVAVPNGTYAAGDNTVALKYLWTADGVDHEDEFASAFNVKTPAPDAFTTPAVMPKIGDDILFTGVNMDVIDEVYVGILKATITAQSATSLTISVPNGSYEAAAPSPAKGSRAETITKSVEIVAYSGKPATALTLASNLTIDITPPAVTAPTFTSVTPVDGGAAAPYKFYLKKEVAVEGTALLGVDRIVVGNLEAQIKEGASNTSLTFIMPEAFAFNTATNQSIVAYYGGDLNLTAVVQQDAKVYPFYYWKGLRLNAQDVAATNKGLAFFNPETGQVVDGRVFLGLDDSDVSVTANAWDPYVYTASSSENKFGSTTTMTAANVINRAVITSADAYRAVSPYIFVTTGSGNTMQFNNPAGSVSQVRNQRFTDFNGEVKGISNNATGYYSGTPMITYRVLVDKEATNNAAIKDGSIESINDVTIIASSSTPRCAATEASGSYIVGSVLLVQHHAYTKAAATPANISEILKSGYLIVTGGKLTATNADATSYVEFDCLWPYNDREITPAP